MYLGVCYALLPAILAAGADALSKKAAAKQSVYLISLSRWVFALPVLALMTFQAEVPRGLGWEVAIYILILMPLEILAMILYIKAIARYDLSMTVPLLSLTPLFLLVTGSVFLGETITPSGIAGVLVVLTGIYIMNISTLKEGLLAPFRAVLTNRGAVLVIIVAIIYTITSTLGKKVVLITGSAFFSFWYLLLLAIGIIPVLCLKGESPLHVFKNFKMNLLIGTLIGLASYSQFAAYTFAPIAYVIAVKRTSIIFSVLLGRLIFQEAAFGKRAFGALLAFIGVVLMMAGT
ncbi:MAG: DMT family transporter [Proteobacteria bacterium]|nr:DMT family transporter [Pseudomonadota bacterium]